MARPGWMLLGVIATACGPRCPVPAHPAPPTGPPGIQANLQLSMTLRLNCEAICRQIGQACRQACRPQAWSPNMQSIADACEHDCDFQRFSCTAECNQSHRGAGR